MRVFLAGVFLVVLFGCSNEKHNDEQSLVTLIHQTLEGTGFNGSIVIGQSDEIVFHQNMGFADTDKTIPISNDHLFSPGSVSKEFTTVSIMQLVAQGKLSYDDSITSFLAQLPEWADDISVEHLLAHTSGLPKVQWKKNITTADVLDQLGKSQRAFDPGTDYFYSNVNVMLRALIVEQVTGKPYSQVLQEAIFAPAGMTHSFQKISSTDSLENLVVGDYPTNLKGVTIYTTPSDLMRFERALSQGRLVPLPLLKSALPGDRLSGKHNRAYFDFGSYHFDENDELAYWEHDGSNPSHHTLKVHDFVNGYAMVIMSSDGNKSTLYQLRDAVRKWMTNQH